MDDATTEIFEPGHDIRVRTFEFACRVVEFCKELYEQGGVARQMTPQLIQLFNFGCGDHWRKPGAQKAVADFISKCSIGLKEARESHVRLRVCHRTSLGPRKRRELLVDEARQIASIIGAIVRNSRRNAGITDRNGGTSEGAQDEFVLTL